MTQERNEKPMLTIPPGLSQKEVQDAMDEEVGHALDAMPALKQMIRRARLGLPTLPETAGRGEPEKAD